LPVAAGLAASLLLSRILILQGLPVRLSGAGVFWLSGLGGDLAVVLAAALAAGLLSGRRWTRWTARALLLGAGLLFQFVWVLYALYFLHPIQKAHFAFLWNREFVAGSSGALRPLPLAMTVLVPWAAALWVGAFVRRPARVPAGAAGLLFLAGAGASLVGPPHFAGLQRNALLAVLAAEEGVAAGAPARGGGTAEAWPEPGFSPERLRELLPPGTVFTDPAYPLMHAGPVPGPGPRPRNVVLFVMEGVRRRETLLEGVAPNLRDLAARGTVFPNAWAHGCFTEVAELALTAGVWDHPARPVVRFQPDLPLAALPGVLRKRGTSGVWVHGGSRFFLDRHRYFQRLGFSMVDQDAFAAGDCRTPWGFSDKALARRAVEVLGRTRPPFFAFILTLSNHHAFDLPADAGPAFYEPGGIREGGILRTAREGLLSLNYARKMTNTVHYTDEALGLFLELAAQEPWFADTLVVVTGDHGLPVAPEEPLADAFEYMETRHTVPLVVAGPGIGAGRTDPRVLSHLDLYPLLLRLLGAEVPNPGVGLDPGGAWTERPRPALVLNDDGWALAVDDGGLLMAKYTRDGGRPRRLETRVRGGGARPDLVAFLTLYMEGYPWLLEQRRLAP
jgi:hypothetical protein